MVENIIFLILSGLVLRFSLSITGQNWVKTYQQTIAFLILPVVTYVITKTITGNIALSLGMIGALSIVRFRNPVKSALELVMYFVLITIGIRLIFFPLANYSFRSMAKMKAVQPEMVRLKELHKEDKVKLQQAMMALYRKEKINPASGCLPVLIQIPFFFAIYKMLFISLDIISISLPSLFPKPYSSLFSSEYASEKRYTL